MTLPAAPEADRPVGAYGLWLEGCAEAAALLVPADPSWPRIALSSTVGEPPWREHDVVTDTTADVRLRTGGEIAIDRKRGTVRYTLPAPLSSAQLVHPYLAPAAAVHAYWLDRESFHAGAVVIGQESWGVVGEREAGKSTLLAQLARVGLPVLTDDMLVLDGDAPFAGPRSLDLRAEAAEHLGLGEPLGVVGARERWRVRLDGVDATPRLRGWIVLEWTDGAVSLERLSPADRTRRLSAQRGLRLPPRDPTRLLDLAALPAWTLRRPRDWAALDSAVAALLDAVSGGG
jgi:hypothetical protein